MEYEAKYNWKSEEEKEQTLFVWGIVAGVFVIIIATCLLEIIGI